MLLNQAYHLSYCTNIHPGETWQEIFDNLVRYLPGIKKTLSPEKPFGIGLRLSDVASQELLEQNKLQQFRKWLDDIGLYVFTLNGFPYGGFHRQVVKDAVHQPDWTTTERAAYTIRLATILAALLPESMAGGISTSPLSYKPWYTGKPDQLEQVFYTSTAHLVQVIQALQSIKEATGKTIHIDLEPEPDGLLENTGEVIRYFQDRLLPQGIKTLMASSNLEETEAREVILEHLQLCYDVCHFALAYEEPVTAFARLKAAGIKIGKIQLSAALKVQLPPGTAARKAVAETLAPFAESTYLHQVVERSINGQLIHYTDLPLALQHIQKPEAREWRTHFHVPLFTASYNKLLSTQDDIVKVLALLQQDQITQHLEVETYTWEVLPEGLKKDVSESIQRELDWVIHTLNQTHHAENGRIERSRAHAVTDR
ncbi:metabolite traffic protein EboE [Pontibacter vulgaris]|uniref:metabolite traffic protein EboE n=1 Tax=Pontibacter vulgaris TaxID=2905679 RepID=UPI001FA77763|nr:metabolite traffic protein EboE [Pontibacter vulgaris]